MQVAVGLPLNPRLLMQHKDSGLELCVSDHVPRKESDNSVVDSISGMRCRLFSLREESLQARRGAKFDAPRFSE